MKIQAFLFLGRTPSFSDQPIDVCPQHRIGVVNRKDGVESRLFELTLSGITASLTFKGPMGCLGKMLFYIVNIMRVLVYRSGFTKTQTMQLPEHHLSHHHAKGPV